MNALILSADQFEDSELLVPYYRLREAGIAVTIASLRAGTLHGKHGYEVTVDLPVDRINAADYGLLVLPGGQAPAALRDNEQVRAIARDFMAGDKPVAAICHGPQILISAGVLGGRRATCYRSVATELSAAGALYEDSEVVVDNRLVTSRQPSDLPAFCREMMRQLGS